MPPDGPYLVIPADPDSTVIVHVPHSSRSIASQVRTGIILSDEELEHELAAMTDAYTDVIAERAAAVAASRPWLFVNRVSRLVVDPERFPDDREEMRRVGMGAVYTRTSMGRPLRADDAATQRRLIEDWYDPYATAMGDLVDARLAATGRATIIDVHSYPTRRLPYELGPRRRPAVCLGTHPRHTPAWLLAAARESFAGCGDVDENTPFAGCYVPLRHLGRAPRVTAVMVEIRRDIYLNAEGTPTGGIDMVSRSLAALINTVTEMARRVPR